MSFTGLWSFSRNVAGMSRDSPNAYDLFELYSSADTRLFVGIVVDNPRYGQLPLLRDAGRMFRVSSWNGHPESFASYLAEVSRQIGDLELSRVIVRENLRLGGVSIGGIAHCIGDRLAIFRLGRFRASVDGAVVLGEHTQREAWRGPDKHGATQTQTTQPDYTEKALPWMTMGPEDLVWLSERGGSPELRYENPFAPPGHGKSLLQVTAHWTG